MSILITGMGVVGINAGRKFVDEGYDVVFYKKSDIPRRVDFLEELPDKVRVTVGNITDFTALLETVDKNKVEGIVHTVGNSDVPYMVSVTGTYNVLEIARLRDLKVLYTSSNSVYSPRKDLSPLKEDDPIPGTQWPAIKGDRRTHYNVQKIACEHLTRLYELYYGLDTVTCRTSFVYGPADTVGRGGPAMLIAKGLLKEPMIMREDPNGHFEWTYAKNLADGIFLAYKVRPIKHRIFNIASGKIYNYLETVDIIKKFAPNLKVQFNPPKYPPIWDRGPSDLTISREELGFKPTLLEEGIQDYLKWLNKQKKPWTLLMGTISLK